MHSLFRARSLFCASHEQVLDYVHFFPQTNYNIPGCAEIESRLHHLSTPSKMARSLFLVASVVSAFASCVSGTYDQSAGQQGGYMQGTGQGMSSGADQSAGQQGGYMQSSGQGMSSGGKQDMSMGGGGSGGMGSSGSNVVVQNNINIVNQPIIVIATNAGGSSQTQQLASQIQAPAATHTVCYSPVYLSPFALVLTNSTFRSRSAATQGWSTLQTQFRPPCTTWCNSTSWPRTTRSLNRPSQSHVTR